MKSQKPKWCADRDARVFKTVREIEASIVALNGDDLSYLYALLGVCCQSVGDPRSRRDEARESNCVEHADCRYYRKYCNRQSSAWRSRRSISSTRPKHLWKSQASGRRRAQTTVPRRSIRQWCDCSSQDICPPRSTMDRDDRHMASVCACLVKTSFTRRAWRFVLIAVSTIKGSKQR